jgi:hypothetical protein
MLIPCAEGNGARKGRRSCWIVLGSFSDILSLLSSIEIMRRGGRAEWNGALMGDEGPRAERQRSGAKNFHFQPETFRPSFHLFALEKRILTLCME